MQQDGPQPPQLNYEPGAIDSHKLQQYQGTKTTRNLKKLQYGMDLPNIGSETVALRLS